MLCKLSKEEIKKKMADASTLLESTGTYEIIRNTLGISSGAVLALMAVISIWTLVWKGLALWKASQKKSVPWFIILLIFNTIGILEILYIFVFSKMGLGKTAKTTTSKPKAKKKKKK